MDRVPPVDESSVRDRWARLRLLIIGQLLAAPPARGELKPRLSELGRQRWRHPMHGGEVRLGVSTLERWFALARRSPDPAAMLSTMPRADAGRMRAIGAALADAIRAQYAAHPKWNIQLHYDNLRVSVDKAALPSYATVLRFFRAQGLWLVGVGAAFLQRAFELFDGGRKGFTSGHFLAFHSIVSEPGESQRSAINRST